MSVMICNDVSQWIGSPKRTTAAEKNLFVRRLALRSYLYLRSAENRCDATDLWFSAVRTRQRTVEVESRRRKASLYQLRPMSVIDHIQFGKIGAQLFDRRRIGETNAENVRKTRFFIDFVARETNVRAISSKAPCPQIKTCFL